MIDPCANCEARGDLEACLRMVCSFREGNWYIQQARADLRRLFNASALPGYFGADCPAYMVLVPADKYDKLQIARSVISEHKL